MHPFKKLILISLGKETSFEKTPLPADWARLFHRAKYQAMLGVLFQGVIRLPDDQLPPDHILRDWTDAANRIEDIHAIHEERVEQLAAILKDLGLRGCILKGTGLSHLYPKPSARQCGDIDVWIAGTHRSILKKIAPKYPVGEILYQECKAGFFNDTIVEVHFHPSKMYNPFTNARLQRWFEKNSPISYGKTLTYPDARFNAVFCMAHMFRHYLEGGIGFRQMLDYYYVLKVLNPADRAEVMKTLRRTGMKRFTGAVMHVLKYTFQLEEEYMLCPPDRKYGSPMLKEILEVGNFGILDKRNRPGKGESRLGRFHRKNSRVFSKLGDYPRQVIWSPLSRVGQFVWRLFNGYI